MSDNKIRRLHSGSTICLSRVWLQTETNDTKSFCQLIIKITISKLKRTLKYCHCSRETNSLFWRKPQFRNLYTVSMVIETKVVIDWFKPQLWMWLVDLNYNFECIWLIELSNNNLASELVENRSFFKTNHNRGNCNSYVNRFIDKLYPFHIIQTELSKIPWL